LSGWFIFFLAYVVFLVVGFSLAFLYRRHLEVKERKFFEELLKIRAHIYTQINALIQTYSELLRISKKKEKSYLADKDSLDLGEAAILARDVQSNLAIIKSELNDLTEDELLGFIYFTFPEMTIESVKFEKIKPKRMNIALSLYAKSKISLGKALEIAGMNIDTFIKEAKLKGIQIYT